MTNRDTAKLIELLRVFINSPCRTKADAEALEAKLAEFEKEIAKPEKPQRLEFVTIKRPVRDGYDVDWFNRNLEQGTEFGFRIEACGVNGSASEHRMLWAILSKPAEEE